MVVTTRVRLDRIASSTRNAHLGEEVIVGDEIIAAEGYVLAVRILEDKPTYNTVEDLTGRMVPLRAGDVLAGTLGARRALRGYAGEVPAHLAIGDSVHVLNLGGILGRCTSVNPAWCVVRTSRGPMPSAARTLRASGWIPSVSVR